MQQNKKTTDKAPSDRTCGDLEALVREEARCIGGDAQVDVVMDDDPLKKLIDEPFVRFPPRDYFGVALSGGGIRSATFNLGLLEGLEDKRMLDEVDYLSTVSGGGYIGGYLTALRQAEIKSKNKQGTTQEEDAEVDASSFNVTDPPKVRHLREFSRFLMPRVGFFRRETWGGIVAILYGTAFSLSATAVLLVLVQLACLVLSFVLGVGLAESVDVWTDLKDHGYASLVEWMGKRKPVQGIGVAVFVGVLTLFMQGFIEMSWKRLNKKNRADAKGGYKNPFIRFITSYTLLAIVSAVLSAIFWYYAAQQSPLGKFSSDSCFFSGFFEEEVSRLEPNLRGVLLLSLVWLSAAAVFVVVRVLLSRLKRVPGLLRRLERTISRLLVHAITTLALFAIWWLAVWLSTSHYIEGATTAVPPIGLGVLFIWLKQWLQKPVVETPLSTATGRIAAVLKSFAPQLVAVAFVLCCFVGTAWFVLYLYVELHLTALLGAIGVTAALFLFFLVVVDPSRFGLHEFYRSRICRAYLGAVRATNADLSRLTLEQDDDDVRLIELTECRPFHLICCTANNLSGDTLSNLYRGGRSAVLSPLGVALGDAYLMQDDLRLSSAMTASAAAFNSQMGSLSVKLGPAVAFVMCAFNLRLGLWIDRPPRTDAEKNRCPKRRRLFRGLEFYKEMLGQTRCGLNDPSESIHLSDGGHFENLALYELVRRHCRCIIVSDSGADPESAFDDLGNAVRRIREDFGVEIEIDIKPLMKNEDGYALQHGVVGTIHYDGSDGVDKGMLLYIKPVLTSDEPPDVRQYKKRNPSFPHETTGDQFYDEAQWEAYRRLGSHAFRSMLRGIAMPDGGAGAIDDVFMNLHRRWLHGIDGYEAVAADIKEKIREVEALICDEAPASLQASLFPEIIREESSEIMPRAEDRVQILYYVMMLVDVIEYAWRTAQLDTEWNHPANEGMMNTFQRFASIPAMRQHWPLLRAMTDPGFDEFARERFGLRVVDSGTREDEDAVEAARLRLITVSPDDISSLKSGFAWRQWRRRNPVPEIDAESSKVFAYHLLMDGAGGTVELQVGFLICRLKTGDDLGLTAEWCVGDLFVPHTLWGAGLHGRFLDAVKTALRQQPKGVDAICVRLVDTAAGQPSSGMKNAGTRRETVRTVSFYRSRGFTYKRSEKDEGIIQTNLHCRLHPNG